MILRHPQKIQSLFCKFVLAIWPKILVIAISLLAISCSPNPGYTEKIIDIPPDKNNGSLDIAFSTNSRIIASASTDGAIYLWEAEDGSPLTSFPHTGEIIHGLAFTQYNQLLAASTQSGIHFWQVSNGQLQQTVAENNIWPGKITFSSDGGLVAMHSGVSVEVWRIADNAKIFQQELPVQSPQKIVAFSPMGDLIAYSGGGAVFIHDIIKNTLVTSFGENLHVASFSTDGQFLITAAPEKVYVWQLPEGQLIKKFTIDYMEAGISTNNGVIAGLFYDRLLDTTFLNEGEGEMATPPGGISMWNINTGDLLWRNYEEDVLLPDLNAGILSLDGTLLAHRGTDNGIYSIWRLDVPAIEE